jgi:hypothetical protein
MGEKAFVRVSVWAELRNVLQLLSDTSTRSGDCSPCFV